MISEKSFYENAIKQFIDYSSKDATATIAHEHGLIGLTRLLACLNSLGLNYDEARMIALPDFTYTRNPNRWEAGFPYGCIICLPKLEKPFVPIDFRPNCCGVTFAEIDPFNESLDVLCQKYYTVIEKYEEIHVNDLNRRNHFLAIYYNKNNNKYYCLLHCSFKFVKQKLYAEHNKLLASAKTFEFLSGNLHYLLNEDAQNYYEYYLKLEKETLNLRESIVKEVFNNASIIFNKTHEGFLNSNTILLGAYADTSEFSYPLMLSPESSLHIITVKKQINLHNENDLYCAPHGGGYALESVVSAHKFNTSHSSKEEFLLKYANECSFLTNNILDMPFNYRANTVYDWCEKYDMAKICDTLVPIINLKL